MMKLTLILSAIFLFMSPLSTHAFKIPITDKMALELGMTLIDDGSGLKSLEQFPRLTKSTVDSKLTDLLRQNRVVVLVNKSASGDGAQTLVLYKDGIEVMRTKVSTGSEKMVRSTSGRRYLSTTPFGFYRPFKMYTDYLSYTWLSGMPNSVFFYEGIAIHATSQSHYAQLGTRASGGCVRMTLDDSKKVREFVMEGGKGSGVGQYVVRREEYKRNRIYNNSIQVAQVDSLLGEFLKDNKGNLIMQDSWDALIVIFEND